MTHEELKNLKPGDIVEHVAGSSPRFMVTGNYGNRVTAVITVDITNPSEWHVVAKAGLKFVTQ